MAGRDRHHRDAESFGQVLGIDFNAPADGQIRHVEGDNHRNLGFDQLGYQVEVAGEIAGVNNGDNGVGRSYTLLAAIEDVDGNSLIHRLRRQAVDSGQIEDLHRLSTAQRHATLETVHRHASVVADLLTQTGERVEKGGFSGIGVADQRNGLAFGLVGGDGHER